jgi:hypothetical protein
MINDSCSKPGRGKRYFSFSKTSGRLQGTRTFCLIGPNSHLSKGKPARTWELSTHLHLVLRLRIRGTNFLTFLWYAWIARGQLSFSFVIILILIRLSQRIFSNCYYFRRIKKIGKATMTFIMSVCPPDLLSSQKHFGSHWMVLLKFDKI